MEKNFEAGTFKSNVEQLPSTAVYAMETPEKLQNVQPPFSVVSVETCSPGTKKVTRPPAPWLKDLQVTAKLFEKESFATGCSHKMQLLGRISKRSEMNSREIYEQSTFYKQALSSKRQKEVWNTIHRILHQNPQTIKADSDIQRLFFQHNSTASSKLQTKSWKYITWPDWWPSTTTQLF